MTTSLMYFELVRVVCQPKIKDERKLNCQGCCLTGAKQLGAPKKMLWVPRFFAAAPKTLPVGLLTSQLLLLWAP